VLTCSALRAPTATRCAPRVPRLRFVHLALTPHQALERVAARTDHFYPPSLVASQFEALEDPAREPACWRPTPRSTSTAWSRRRALAGAGLVQHRA
jgi:gluconokinase